VVSCAVLFKLVGDLRYRCSYFCRKSKVALLLELWSERQAECCRGRRDQRTFPGSDNSLNGACVDKIILLSQQDDLGEPSALHGALRRRLPQSMMLEKVPG
jgi:hypothetical protein